MRWRLETTYKWAALSGIQPNHGLGPKLLHRPLYEMAIRNYVQVEKVVSGTTAFQEPTVAEPWHGHQKAAPAHPLSRLGGSLVWIEVSRTIKVSVVNSRHQRLLPVHPERMAEQRLLDERGYSPYTG
jgi:hypothetical protein